MTTWINGRFVEEKPTNTTISNTDLVAEVKNQLYKYVEEKLKTVDNTEEHVDEGVLILDEV